MTTFNTEPIPAGGVPALDGVGVLAGAGTGFLGSNEQCAYQIVWGYSDVNGNLILGNPSERILVVNATGGADNVTLTFSVPQLVTSSGPFWFYQIYRTPQTVFSATPADNVPPGAEPQLAAQLPISAAQVTAGSVTFTDVTTDALLGAALYTNPSQQGATQTNDRPPYCADMCFFSQMMFYANATSLYSIQLTLISAGAPNGIQIGDTVSVDYGSGSLSFTGATSQNNAAQQFAIVTTGTVAQNIDATARNIVACLNANAATTNVYAFYVSGYSDLPGKILFQNVGYPPLGFNIGSSRGSAWLEFEGSVGFSAAASNDATPNGIYVSKVGQPEAVPLTNLILVGGGDQPILRVLPLRDRVIVLKTDGVWVITGSTPDALSVTLLDSTIICIGVESARLLNNSVYCLSQQGVVSITESGVTIQSRAIESDLLSLTGPNFTNFQKCCFGIAYESERLFILAMPTNTTDTYGTQAFCYNWITNIWTRWPIDIGTGIVNPFDNTLYLGRPLVKLGNTQEQVNKERKNYNYTDYMDDQFSVTVTAVDPTKTILTLHLSGALSGSLFPPLTLVGTYIDQTINGVEYMAIITAFDKTSGNATVDLQNSTTPGTIIPWTVGAATIDVPIPIAVTYAPLTGGFPHYLKSFGRLNYWFNNGNFPSITAGFISDSMAGPSQVLNTLISGGYGFGPYNANPYGGTFNYPQSLQTLVPVDSSLARWIMPILQLSFPQARFSCLGVTASYDIVSDVSG